MDTEAVVDATTDIVETVVEHADVVEAVVRNNPVVVAGALIGGLVIGAAVSHIVTKKYLTVKYEEIVTNELAVARSMYIKRIREHERKYEGPTVHVQEYEEVAEVAEVVEDADDAEVASDIADKEGYTAYHTVKTEVTQTDTIVSNIQSLVFSPEVEEQKRKMHKPYIIDFDTYVENASDHHQQTLTYYDGDEVLVDEEDDVVDDYRNVIGYDNLRFGCGSEDPTTVYIRNDRLDSDYEVVLVKGNYHEIVLGE